MRPYPTDNGRVSRQKEISNYRLSRERRRVECAFGILIAKWRCLKTELQVNPVMLEAQGAITVLNKMHAVYETGSCNI